MPADVPARTPAEAVRLQYLASATGGTVSAAARADYAAVLASEGHENRAYELGGDKAFTLEDLAAAIAARTGDAPPIHQDLAGGRLLEPRDDAQHGRLAAAGGADQAHELALCDGRINAAERLDLAIARGEALGDATQRYVRPYYLTHDAAGSIATADC